MTDKTQLFYIAEYFYAVSAMFIKISVAVTLLRIASTRPVFQWSLYALIAATAIAALVFVVGIANICTFNLRLRRIVTNKAGHPISTLWGEANGVCNLQLNTNVSLFFSAIEILTDFSLSIMPAILLWNVQMKGRVKASVAVMLALASLSVFTNKIILYVSSLTRFQCFMRNHRPTQISHTLQRPRRVPVRYRKDRFLVFDRRGHRHHSGLPTCSSSSPLPSDKD
jgi:hypothetical protein